MLIPEVLKEHEDPSGTAEGKVAVTARYGLALTQPWLRLLWNLHFSPWFVVAAQPRENPYFTDFTGYKVISLPCVV